MTFINKSDIQKKPNILMKFLIGPWNTESSFEFAVESSYRAGVKKLLLTHHDPERTDEELDTLIDFYRKKYQDISREMDFSLAVEGSEFYL